MVPAGALTIEETGTPGEQLYNYLLAREKQYKMRVLRMTPVILDPDAVMVSLAVHSVAKNRAGIFNLPYHSLVKLRITFFHCTLILCDLHLYQGSRYTF